MSHRKSMPAKPKQKLSYFREALTAFMVPSPDFLMLASVSSFSLDSSSYFFWSFSTSEVKVLSAFSCSFSLPLIASSSSASDMSVNFLISAFWSSEQSSRLLGSPHLTVGYPLTPTVSQRLCPSAVQSTSATRAEAWPSKSAISLSHAGFMLLQCPHQGARNLTKTVLPAVLSSQLSEVSSVAAAAPRSASAIRNWWH